MAGGVGVLGIYDFEVVKESTWDKCLPVCFSSLRFCLVPLEKVSSFLNLEVEKFIIIILANVGGGKECLCYFRN